MIKHLKLRMAVVVVILGIIALVVARIMEENKVEGRNLVLGISGAFLIIGALMFLYPILFAKKADKDGKKVVLKPINDEEVDAETTN